MPDSSWFNITEGSQRHTETGILEWICYFENLLIHPGSVQRHTIDQ